MLHRFCNIITTMRQSTYYTFKRIYYASKYHTKNLINNVVDRMINIWVDSF